MIFGEDIIRYFTKINIHFDVSNKRQNLFINIAASRTLIDKLGDLTEAAWKQVTLLE